MVLRKSFDAAHGFTVDDLVFPDHIYRNAIPLTARTEGMLAYTSNDRTIWQLKPGPWNKTDADWKAVGGDGTLYVNDEATTLSVGGIPAGSTFAEPQTLQEMFDALLYPYQAPAFASFGISGSDTVEVGYSLGPGVTFNWTTTQSANIMPNSISITDGATVLGTLIANTGSYAATLGAAIQRTSPGTHAFGIAALNSNSGALTRGCVVTWQWRLYFGANASATLSAAAILALSSSRLATGYAGSYAMEAGGYKFICLADDAGGQISSVKDASTQLSVPMASGTFTDGGGYGYEKVSVTNAQGVTANVRVYRTLNVLGGAITLVVA